MRERLSRGRYLRSGVVFSAALLVALIGGRGNGVQAAGSEETPPALAQLRFHGDATHPAGVPSPEGRVGDWRVTVGNIGSSSDVEASYALSQSHKWELATIRLQAVKEQLTVTGNVKTLRIDLVLESQHNRDDASCPAGMRGTVLAIDNDGKLANGQERDQVIANFPRCPVFSHVYGNANSATHEPSFGGLKGSEPNQRGGQWTHVQIGVQPTEFTFTVNQGGDVGTVHYSLVKPTSSIGPTLNGVDRKADIRVSAKLDEPLPKGWDFNILRTSDPLSQGNGVYYFICHTAEGAKNCGLCPGGLRGLQPANVTWQQWYTKPCGPVIKRPPSPPAIGGDQLCVRLQSPTGGWGACITIAYLPS